jgi:hypothetical protein
MHLATQWDPSGFDGASGIVESGLWTTDTLFVEY